MVVVTGTINGNNYVTPPATTAGLPIVSNGAPNPIYGVAAVPGGGTGNSSNTAFAPLCGGATTTSHLQSASTGQSSSGSVFTSTGTSSLPTWQTLATVGAVTSIAGDTGTATPSAGVISITATGTGMTFTGAGNNLTFGGVLGTPNGGTGRGLLTNHSVIIGAGASAVTQLGPTATAGQVLQSGGSSADPAFSTATYPATTTANQILYSSATNTVAGLATANSAVLVTNSSGVPVLSSTMTNGQVIIGSTGATPTAATLTAGSGISITNGAGSISIASSGGGLSWSTVTTNTTMVSNSGYITNSVSQLQMTLPASSAIGDKIHIKGLQISGGWIVQQNSGQHIIVSGGSQTTTGTGGSITSNSGLDTIVMTCMTAGSVWSVDFMNSQGVTVV